MLLEARRRFQVGCVDCVAGFVSILGCWIVWIVLLGCVDSGCVNLVAGFVSISGCWIVLLGYVDSGCVNLVAGFVFLVCWVCCRWVVWIPV